MIIDRSGLKIYNRVLHFENGSKIDKIDENVVDEIFVRDIKVVVRTTCKISPNEIIREGF